MENCWNFKDFRSTDPSSRCHLEESERKDCNWWEGPGDGLKMVQGHLHIINTIFLANDILNILATTIFTTLILVHYRKKSEIP